jgi:hypothetical protein
MSWLVLDDIVSQGRVDGSMDRTTNIEFLGRQLALGGF